MAKAVEGEVVNWQGSGQISALTSWPHAYMRFLRSKTESRILKIAPLALMGIIPVAVLDDLFLPILGVFDDLPTSLLTIAVVFWTWSRVRKYR